MAENLRLDRVSLGAKDVDASAGWLTSVSGLVADESWWFRSGLVNRIACSGGAAVEIIGVGFPGAEMVSPLVGQVHARTIAGDRWITWAVATDDIDATAARLGLEVMDGWAMSTAGEPVIWRMAGVVEAFFSEPYLPYFVAYPDGDQSWQARAMQQAPFDISCLKLSGDAARLAEWLGGAQLPIEIADGPAAIDDVAVRIGNNEIELNPGVS